MSLYTENGKKFLTFLNRMAEEAVQSVKCDSLESEPEDRQRFLKKNKSPVNQSLEITSH